MDVGIQRGEVDWFVAEEDGDVVLGMRLDDCIEDGTADETGAAGPSQFSVIPVLLWTGAYKKILGAIVAEIGTVGEVAVSVSEESSCLL